MKHVNTPCKEVQRIKVDIITGVNGEGEWIKPWSYDLERDHLHLEKFLAFSPSYIGFSVDASYYEEDAYIEGDLGMNEYVPLQQYLIGDDKGATYLSCGGEYVKFPFIEVVKDKAELERKLADIMLSIKEAGDLESFVNLCQEKNSQKKIGTV